MKFRGRLLLPFLAFVIGIFLPGAAFAQEKWVGVESKNFQLIGNADETEIRRVAAELEKFREVFRQLFDRLSLTAPIPTRVIVFRDDESFRPFQPLTAAGTPRDFVRGYFQSGVDVNYIALSLGQGKTDVYGTIFHEYVHFLMNNNFGQSKIPPWLNEGLAEYYESFAFEKDGKIRLGGLSKNDLALLKQQPLVPLDQFFATDYYTLNRMEKQSAGLFYAQAGALLNHLLERGGARSDQKINELFEALRRGQKPADAVLEIFQTDVPALERDLEKYIEQKKFAVTVTALDRALDLATGARTFPVTTIEARAVLGDLLAHTDRLPAAAALLEEVLRTDPASSPANASLGLVKMRQENFPAAKNHLEKAVRGGGQNYLPHFLLAYVLSREEMSGFGFVGGYSREAADLIRHHLLEAISLNPAFAESYNLFAYVAVVRNEQIDQALKFIATALELAPGNQTYQLRRAELLMRRQDFSLARHLARQVFDAAATDDMRVYAQNVVNLINTFEAQLEAIKDQKRLDETDVPDVPLTEAELERLKERKSLEALNEALRRPLDGEKRTLGRLTDIECRSDGVFYLFDTGNESLRLRSKNLNAVILINYDPLMKDAIFGCAAAAGENRAVIVYRPAGAGNTAGELKSIEFVPQNFSFPDRD